MVEEGGEVTGGDNLLLKKEGDEAVAYADWEAKPEEQQEAVLHGGAPEPEAKPEDKQDPGDRREPPPARGEPLLPQKGPEADVATGGGTGCGCVLSHALLPFRMSGYDVALGTSGSALRVSRVLCVGFMRVPRDLRRALHVSRVLPNGRRRLRVKMMKNGTRMRYSGDRLRSQQGRLLRGTHWASDHTHHRYNSTGSDDFIHKEWEGEWEEGAQNAADTRIVSGDKFRDNVHNAPSVIAHQGPAEGQRGGGGNRRGTVGSGQWAEQPSGVLVPATVCIVEQVATALRGPAWLGAQATQQPISSINNSLLCASPQRGRPALPGGVRLSGAVVGWEAVHMVAGKAGVGAAGPRGGQRVAAAAGEEEWKERRKVKGR